MNPLIRPLRSTFNRAARHRLAVRPVTSPILHKRTEANYPGLKPGSQTLSHAAQNIREEAGNSAKDLAKVTAGANVHVQDEAKDSFLGVTSAIASDVPKPVLLFGLAGRNLDLLGFVGLIFAGCLPYIGAGATTALSVQVTYGAVILSFLGALHWGMESKFAGLGGHHGWRRLALGTAPLLYAWPTLALEPTNALIVQWVGFTWLWLADLQATSAGWTPKWYAQYRFYLSTLTGTCILGSLAGIIYWDHVGKNGLLEHERQLARDELQLARDERRAQRALHENPEMKYGSGMTILKGGDTFTRLRKTEDVREEAAKAKREGKQQ
ncbi:hypothetical protein GGX14DRAFT_648810 [Mycena pura]|uniref:Uncharacterized protein n=1 Tax=Mycena pura TaxID=153505 RepID=A0AAD6YMR4_9AGAR|nr:hypothetical protein GGX14DRAFT_648810 [Mycena pura]